MKTNSKPFSILNKATYKIQKDGQINLSSNR